MWCKCNAFLKLRNNIRSFPTKIAYMNSESPIIIAETPSWIALDKPANWIVERHPHHPSLENWLLEVHLRAHKKPFVGIVHRLDRPVSGIVLVAKKRSTLKVLNEQFANRRIQKFYEATTDHRPAQNSGKLLHHLRRSATSRAAEVTTEQLGKRAELRYRLLAKIKGHYKLEIVLLTGRYHQIRTQLSAAGMPILNDELYGGTPVSGKLGIALRAVKLVFTDPETEARRTLKI